MLAEEEDLAILNGEIDLELRQLDEFVMETAPPKKVKKEKKLRSKERCSDKDASTEHEISRKTKDKDTGEVHKLKDVTNAPPIRSVNSTSTVESDLGGIASGTTWKRAFTNI